MTIKCEWCGKSRRDAVSLYGYTDEKNGIGHKMEHTTNLGSVTLCCECLYKHVSKYYPGSPIYKDCKQRLEYAGLISASTP